jgi:hypothetical protein
MPEKYNQRLQISQCEMLLLPSAAYAKMTVSKTFVTFLSPHILGQMDDLPFAPFQRKVAVNEKKSVQDFSEVNK